MNNVQVASFMMNTVSLSVPASVLLLVSVATQRLRMNGMGNLQWRVKSTQF